MLVKAISHLQDSFRGIPRAVWLLSAVSLINRSGAMVVCFITLYLTQSLHFDIRFAGYVMSCFGLGSVAGAYLGGYLTDKMGYHRVQLLTLLVSGVLLLTAIFIREFYLMCFIMALNGMASEAFRPANSVAIRTHSDEQTRTRSLSLMRVAVNVAISFALIVGGILISFGWHWLFIADGFSCFGAALILQLFLKEKKETPQYIAPKMAILKENEIKLLGKSAYRDTNYLIFIFCTFLGATVFMQIIWTIPAFFKVVYGWSEAKIGLVAAINGISVVVLEMPLIFRIEKKRSKMWFVRLGILLYGISYIALILPSEWAMQIAVFYMILISFGEIFVMPFSTNWAISQSPKDRQGQYLALYTMAYSASSVIAPALGTQIIAAFGFNVLWWILGGLSIVAWLGFWYLERRNI